MPYIGDRCPATVVDRDGCEDACDEPATKVGRFYEDEWDEEGWLEPACERHADRFPLSDVLGVYGQWFPSVGSFLMSEVTSS